MDELCIVDSEVVVSQCIILYIYICALYIYIFYVIWLEYGRAVVDVVLAVSRPPGDWSGPRGA